MPNKITLALTLAPPLPQRKFLIVCQQRTVRDLKAEILRRFHSIISGGQTITLTNTDYYELMDDDEVKDLLASGSELLVHLESSFLGDATSTSNPPEENKQQTSLTISRREHLPDQDMDYDPAADEQRFPVVAAYEQAAAENSTELCEEADQEHVLEAESDGVLSGYN